MTGTHPGGEHATSGGDMSEDEDDKRRETMEKLEEDPPTNLEDWPSDQTKYDTFGGGEGDHGYDEGVEKKLGPSGVRHHEDGSVSIDGEKVDNPEDYKGEPIPGGPTDPNTPDTAVDRKRKEIKGDGDGEGSGARERGGDDD